MRVLIRNGRVVDPSQALDEGLDILVEDGKIVRLSERIAVPRADVLVDAAGMVVAPGFIDPHVHLREPGFEYKETIATGLKAAVCGGFTAVAPMPNTDPPNDNPAVTSHILRQARRLGLARVWPVGCITKGRAGEELAEMGRVKAAGAVAVSDDGSPVANSALMRRALEYAKSFSLPVLAHEEDPQLASGGAMNEGPAATEAGLPGIPGAAEDVMVARDLILADLTGGRLHVQHVSTATSIELIRWAKARGVGVTCEVTPHHLILTDEDVARSGYDPNWKVNPPLRTEADRLALVEAVKDGTVDAIGSDHAPHHPDEKALEFDQAPFGFVGLEVAVSACIDLLVHREGLPVMRLVELFSTGPARVLGVPGGTLRAGAVADVTFIDLSTRVVVDPERFMSKGKNTPFAGRAFRGRPVGVMVAGQMVCWRGELHPRGATFSAG